MSTGVSRRPAELREGVRNVRTSSAGVAVHGGCVAAGTDSTRIHHAGMKRPAVGAAVRERWSENAGQRRGTASEGSRPDAGRDGSQACTRERSRASAAMLTAFAHRLLQSDMTREPTLNMGFTIKLIGGWPRIRQSLYYIEQFRNWHACFIAPVSCFEARIPRNPSCLTPRFHR